MFTISLHNLVFHAFHGLYEEETVLGNEFIVNASVDFDSDEPVHNLRQTIDYVAVYDIIKQHMLQPTPLLETLAQQITQAILDFDNRIEQVSISIEKKNPPISHMQGSVSVACKKRRS